MFRKRWVKRIAVVLCTMIVLGIATVMITNLIVRKSAQNRILSPQEAALLEVDCVLVLGAGVREDDPSPMLRDRLDVGIEMYQKGASNRLLMSGDHGQEDYDEVNVMKQYAIDAGVPSEHVFMDHAGFSTYDSLYRARDIFGVKRVLIVTQEYHLYRALYIARGLGLEAYGVPADLYEYGGQSLREMREMVARTKDFFMVMLQLEPSILGDPIPVFGNGNDTND